MGDNWIIGLGADEREYKIGDVTYIVTSHFAKPTDSEKLTISDRMKRFVGGDFADLTDELDTNTMNAEYGCSAAGNGGRSEQKESANRAFSCSGPQFAKANCPTKGGKTKCSRKQN